MVIYKIFVFGADRKSNMAARAHNVFWLVEILKVFFVRNHLANWIVTLQEWSLGGPVLNLWIICQSEIQDGCHDLVYDHPMNISAKFGSNLFCSFRKKDENVKFP
jgi:hypothetical protein